MKNNDYKKYMALLLTGMMLATSPAISHSLASADTDADEAQDVTLSENSVSANEAEEEPIADEPNEGEAESIPETVPEEEPLFTSAVIEGEALVDGEVAAKYAGEMEFDLYAGGKVIDTAKNTADGSFGFNRIFYTAEDEGESYHYQIKERSAGEEKGSLEHPDETVDVVVDISKDEDERLVSTVTYSNGDSAFFNAAEVEFDNDEIEVEEDAQEDIGYRGESGDDEKVKVNEEVSRPITLQVKLTAEDSSEALSGATYELYAGDPNDNIPDTSAKIYSAEEGEYVDQISETDENGDMTFENLTDGKYYLLEIEAPEGYKLSGEREAAFEVYTDEAGRRHVSGAEKVNEYTVYTALTNEKTMVSITKTDANSGDALVGASLEVFKKASGEPVAEWTSDEGSKSLRSLDVNTEYVLRETKTADEVEQDGNVYAYKEAKDTVFSLDEYGNVSVVSGEDAQLVGSSVMNLNSERIPVEKEVVTVKEKTVTKDRTVTEKGEDRTETKKVQDPDTVKTVYENVPSASNQTVTGSVSTTKAAAASDRSASVVTRTVNAVRTGDYAPIAILVILMIAAAGAIVGVIIKKKKQ